MSSLSTRTFRHFCRILALFLTLVLQVAAYAQTVVRVDGDNGVPNPVGQGNAWGPDAFKYLKDAIAFAKFNPGGEDLWVAATDPSNPYRPDRDANNEGGTGLRASTFLLDFNNVQVLGGFPPGGGDLADRDPALYETVLSGFLIPGCGAPDTGNCFQANGTPGCDDAECCEAVCAVDPDCCGVTWDQACADLAFTVCGACGDPGAGNCFGDNGTPGCDDPACCSAVCVFDPSCCLTGWDQDCADLATQICGDCGVPGSGDCFLPNGTPGCEDVCGGQNCPGCCWLVCEMDPFCCLGFGEWDDQCANSAENLCSPPTPSDPPKAYHVVTADGVDDSVRLDGFKITHGLADGGVGNDRGAGMFISNASLAVVRVTFTENEAPGHGGGAMNITGNSDPLVVNTSFIENTGNEAGALHTEGGFSGGTFVNCLFSENTSVIEGGAINPGADGDLNFINCTIVYNSVANAAGGGAIFTESPGSGLVNLTNCILWGNKAGDDLNQIRDNEDELSVTYSDVQGFLDPGWNDGFNINDDPLFVDAGIGDYRLLETSPCIDFGNNDDVPCDQFDLDNDGITCDEFDPENNEGTPDLDLINRILPGDPNGEAIVDMGSYEFRHPDVCSCPDICPADLNGDCVVGVKDLLILLGNWGPCDECNNCPADLVVDCVVGVKDLLFLLGWWGPCPCAPQAPVPSLQEAVEDAGLTWPDDWDEFQDVMTDPNSSQAEKDNYYCWMDHYLNHCTMACTTASCPDDDPFGDHRH